MWTYPPPEPIDVTPVLVTMPPAPGEARVGTDRGSKHSVNALQELKWKSCPDYTGVPCGSEGDRIGQWGSHA